MSTNISGNPGADPGGVQMVPWNPPFGIALILLDELLTTFSLTKTSLLVKEHLLLRQTLLGSDYLLLLGIVRS